MCTVKISKCFRTGFERSDHGRLSEGHLDVVVARVGACSADSAREPSQLGGSESGWAIRPLDRLNATDFLDNQEVRAALNDIDQPPEACSDRLRIALLAQHGGVWVDATTYCLRPLDDWLFDVLGPGFFAFDRPGPDRLISSWFLAAEPNNYIIRRWAELTLQYWRNRPQRDDYFWFHHLFGSEYRNDIEFGEIYDRMPKLSADGPHYYIPQDVTLWAPVTELDRAMLTNGEIPLLKLSHKLRRDEYPVDLLPNTFASG